MTTTHGRIETSPQGRSEQELHTMNIVILLVIAALVFVAVLVIGQKVREFFYGVQVKRNERAAQAYLHN